MRRESRRRKSLKSRKFLQVLGIVLVGVSALAWGAFGLIQREFPNVERLKDHYPENSPDIRLRRTPPPGWVRLSAISEAARGAVLVSEDWAFFSHPGYDLNQIKEALQHDLKTGRLSRGASTITQQVVKNVFLSQEKTFWRKLRELVLAGRLERAVGKRRILEIYFNIVEWGPDIYGIGEASRHYFGKSPSELTAREGAFLAMLLPSPKRYSQSFRQQKLSAYASETIENILSKMVRASMLSEEERDAALSDRMSFETATETSEQEEMTED